VVGKFKTLILVAKYLKHGRQFSAVCYAACLEIMEPTADPNIPYAMK